MSNDAFRKIAIETLAMLMRRYPKAFPLRESEIRPLKVGIRDDIIAANGDIDPRAVGMALRFHTSRLVYLFAVTPEAPRIDLDGVVVGAVTSEEAAFAADKLFHCARKRERARAQRAAEQAVANPKPKPLGLADLKVAAQKRRMTADSGRAKAEVEAPSATPTSASEAVR
jgi:ProP effector